MQIHFDAIGDRSVRGHNADQREGARPERSIAAEELKEAAATLQKTGAAGNNHSAGDDKHDIPYQEANNEASR
jgi:hypothetical protein